MDERQFIAAMDHIVAALRERGYDPYAQLTGYVTETTPRIGFWLDNSNQTPQQTAENILNARKPV